MIDIFIKVLLCNAGNNLALLDGKVIGKVIGGYNKRRWRKSPTVLCP